MMVENEAAMIHFPYDKGQMASLEAVKAYQDELGRMTFDQSEFAEEHFVINAQLTPHRKYRQALLHYDGRMHTLASSRAKHEQTRALMQKCELAVKLLQRVQEKISKAGSLKEAMPIPVYETDIQDGAERKVVKFDPYFFINAFSEDEWPDCKAALLQELDTIIKVKSIELVEAGRGEFQQQKLVKDAEERIAFYEKLLPRLKAEVDATGLDNEKAEELYWTLRYKRKAECDLLSRRLGLPSDYIESISQLPESTASSIIAFAMDQQKLLETEGVTPTFNYQKHVTNACRALGSVDRSLLALDDKHNAERGLEGKIFVACLYRNEEEANLLGASDPEGTLVDPRGYQVKYERIWGLRTDHARNTAVQHALEANADWLFFVDDDVILPRTALQDLLAANEDIIGAEYPLKKNPYESAAIVFVDGKQASPVVYDADAGRSKLIPAMESIDKNGIIPVNGIVPTGAMLINCKALHSMGSDWFTEYWKTHAQGVTSMVRTDDYQFTQRAIEQGYSPKLHTGIRCLHVDMQRQRVFGVKTDGVEYCFNRRRSPFLRVTENRSPARVAIGCPVSKPSDVPISVRERILTPKGFDIAQQTISPIGFTIAEAYNMITKTCLENGVDYLFVYETDMIIPQNSLSRLLGLMEDDKNLTFVCGSYILKDTTSQSAALSLDENGKVVAFPRPFEERGLVECNWVVPMGCAIIRMSHAADVPFPWFKEVHASPQAPVAIDWYGDTRVITQTMTQDAFFTERLFKAGFKVHIDTDLQCLHVDKRSGHVFGSPRYVKGHQAIPSELWHFAVTEETSKMFQIAAEMDRVTFRP